MHADLEQVYTAVARATVYINDQMMCVPACSGKRAYKPYSSYSERCCVGTARCCVSTAFRASVSRGVTAENYIIGGAGYMALRRLLREHRSTHGPGPAAGPPDYGRATVAGRRDQPSSQGSKPEIVEGWSP